MQSRGQNLHEKKHRQSHSPQMTACRSPFGNRAKIGGRILDMAVSTPNEPLQRPLNALHPHIGDDENLEQNPKSKLCKIQFHLVSESQHLPIFLSLTLFLQYSPYSPTHTTLSLIGTQQDQKSSILLSGIPQILNRRNGNSQRVLAGGIPGCLAAPECKNRVDVSRKQFTQVDANLRAGVPNDWSLSLGWRKRRPRMNSTGHRDSGFALVHGL
jgi:hypothetical protein